MRIRCTCAGWVIVEEIYDFSVVEAVVDSVTRGRGDLRRGIYRFAPAHHLWQ